MNAIAFVTTVSNCNEMVLIIRCKRVSTESRLKFLVLFRVRVCGTSGKSVPRDWVKSVFRNARHDNFSFVCHARKQRAPHRLVFLDLKFTLNYASRIAQFPRRNRCVSPLIGGEERQLETTN